MLIKFSFGDNPQIFGITDSLQKGLISVYIFNSPSSWDQIALENGDLNLELDVLANKYKTACILRIDHNRHVIEFIRDIPGSRMVYYYLSADKKTLIISDSITGIKENLVFFGLDYERALLFLHNRKHYHLKTAFKSVDILLPGFGLKYDMLNSDLSGFRWYDYFQPTVKMSLKDAALSYRSSVDSAILRTIDTSKETALMFSGGSDSALLLERMLALGIDNLTLFHVKVKGKETEYQRAIRSARFFNREFITIEVESEKLIEPWFEQLSNNYICLSDVRFDGMFAASIQIYEKLRVFYNSRPVNVVWGLQHSIAAPGIGPSLLIKNLAFLPLIRVSGLLGIRSVSDFLDKMILRSTNIDGFNSPKIQVAELRGQISSYTSRLTKLSELLNLKILFSNARKKEFSIERQNSLSRDLFPECKNIFPFYDREHQEENLGLSYLARIGGLKGIFKGSWSYKSLTIRAFETNISAEYVLGGTKQALSSWRSTLQSEILYYKLKGYLDSNTKKAAAFQSMYKDSLTSLENFKNCSSEQLEVITGVVLLISKVDSAE